MAIVTMKQLLETGVHFGHRTQRWDPKMARYIYTQRNGVHIIDLQQTVKSLEKAYGTRTRCRCQRRADALCGHKATGAGKHPAGSTPLPNALCESPVAGRNIDQLAHHQASGLIT